MGTHAATALGLMNTGPRLFKGTGNSFFFFSWFIYSYDICVTHPNLTLKICHFSTVFLYYTKFTVCQTMRGTPDGHLAPEICLRLSFATTCQQIFMLPSCKQNWQLKFHLLGPLQKVRCDIRTVKSVFGSFIVHRRRSQTSSTAFTYHTLLERCKLHETRHKSRLLCHGVPFPSLSLDEMFRINVSRNERKDVIVTEE